LNAPEDNRLRAFRREGRGELAKTLDLHGRVSDITTTPITRGSWANPNIAGASPPQQESSATMTDESSDPPSAKGIQGGDDWTTKCPANALYRQTQPGITKIQTIEARIRNFKSTAHSEAPLSKYLS